VTKKVRILPSGHEFACEGNSTLLEAGLQSGLALGYGCSNGACGECLAKIVAGEVKQTRHHDYRISNEKRAGNYVLMCCNNALSDVVLEAAEAQGTHEIPQQDITARVKSIELVNSVALLHLKTPRTNRLRFLAGQHVQLGGNNMPVASHSVASCPCDDMNLHFQIPRFWGDDFSRHVFETLKRGDPVDIKGPSGDFILHESSPRPLVFIAWHTGFGPIRSLVEQAMALENTESIRLVWVTTNKEDRYLDNLCRSWQDALDDFNYIPVDTGNSVGKEDMERLIVDHVAIEPKELANHDFYIAGNEFLLDACRKVLINKGVPAEQLILDRLIHT
jgi:CDP-4-dehydro-6-deoxyglucose reductase